VGERTNCLNSQGIERGLVARSANTTLAEAARKGAEGRAGVREAAHGGGENGAKKFFFEGAFCGVYIEMTQ